MASKKNTKTTRKAGRKRKRGSSPVPQERPKFIFFPEQVLNHDPERRVTRKMKQVDDHNNLPKLLNMPDEILLSICDKLDFLDRTVLALTCKSLAAKLQGHNLLCWDGPANYHLSPGLGKLESFFEKRLQKDWVPSELKYCRNCGKYLRRLNKRFWLAKLQTRYGGKLGLTSAFVDKHFLRTYFPIGCNQTFEMLWHMSATTGIKRPRSTSPETVTDEKSKLIRFPDNMLTTTTVPVKIPAKKKPGIRKRKAAGIQEINLLELPNELLKRIFSTLTFADCMVLALTCKTLARKLDYNGQLDFPSSSPSSNQSTTATIDVDNMNSLKYFPRLRLGNKFFPADSKYCNWCGKYLPRDVGYWKGKLLVEFGAGSGRYADRVRRWNQKRIAGLGEQPTVLEQRIGRWGASHRGRKCPRCYVMSCEE